ncbi:MAG: sporulation integral membrane protein YtvI [Clostridia bacterium]|nr:sporulation integral membrane protein YtvI [Clostridia bacterium]
MFKKDYQEYLKILLPVSIIVLALLGVYLLAYYIFPYLGSVGYMLVGATTPFIIAIIIAILIDPLVNFLEIKLKIKRGIAVLISLFISLTGISVLLLLISSRLLVELVDMSRDLPNFTTTMAQDLWLLFREVREYISSNPLPLEVQEAVQENILAVLEWAKQLLTSSTEAVIGVVASLPILFLIIIVSAVATFFFSKDKDEIYRFVYSILPKKLIKPVDNISNTLNKALSGFVRAQTFLISLTGIQTVIGLYLLNVKYAFTIGILVGLCDILPILGPGTILIPWAIWHFIIGNYSFGLALLVLYAFVVVVRQIIEPKVLGSSIGLHPLATLMAIFIGLRLWGALGILIAPVLFIIIGAILKTYGILKEK